MDSQRIQRQELLTERTLGWQIKQQGSASRILRRARQDLTPGEQQLLRFHSRVCAINYPANGLTAQSLGRIPAAVSVCVMGQNQRQLIRAVGIVQFHRRRKTTQQHRHWFLSHGKLKGLRGLSQGQHGLDCTARIQRQWLPGLIKQCHGHRNHQRLLICLTRRRRSVLTQRQPVATICILVADR